MDTILNYLKDFFAWLLDLLLWLPLKIAELLFDALASIVEAIPVPDFVSNAGGLFAALPPGAMFFLEPMHLGTGISIVVSAYTLRFFIRRIPVIG